MRREWCHGGGTQQPSPASDSGTRARCLYSFLLETEQSAVPRTEAGRKPSHSAEGDPGEILLGRLGVPGAEGYS